MSKRLWLFFYGYLIINMTGIRPQRLFPILFQEGITIWEVTGEGDSLSFCVALRDLEQLLAVARSINCPVSIVRRIGLPFCYSFIRERSFLFAGLLIIILVIYTLSSFIWFVEIKGLTTIDERDIYHLLSKQGLFPGAYGENLDIDRIEKNILQWENRIAWVSIELMGSMAVVHVLEKVLPQREEGGHLYSTRDAIVTKMVLLKGEAQVQEGDTVRRGQLLVAGEKEGEEVVARAIVEGRTWYEAFGYAYKKERIEYSTGAVGTSYRLQFLPDFSLHVWGPRESPFPDFTLKTNSHLLYRGRNLNLPIELIRRDYQQQLILYRLYTPSMARAKAQEEALREILPQLHDGAIILGVESSLFQEGREGVGVHLQVEVWENIAGKMGFSP